MPETFEKGFGFGSYIDEESKETAQVLEMKEDPSVEDTQEFTHEVSTPKSPAPKYEISQRPLRAKKRR